MKVVELLLKYEADISAVTEVWGVLLGGVFFGDVQTNLCFQGH